MYDRQLGFRFRLIAVLSGSILLIAGCAASRGVSGFTPVDRTGPSCRRVAGQLEAAFGGRQHNEAVETRLDTILRRLSSGIPGLQVTCRVHLLASDEMNAFAISDGNIYVTIGLYRRLDSDQLVAAVLSHELGHVIARDGRRPLAPAEDPLTREIAADTRGLSYLSAAGFDPHAMLRVLELIRNEQDPAWYAARLDNIRERLAASRAATVDAP